MGTWEMLGNMRVILGNDMNHAKAEYLLESVITKVLKYTRRSELDSGLSMIVCEIAAQRYRTQNLGSADAPQVVSSISDADQSVSFKHSDSSFTACAELSDSEKAMLNEWRRLW